MRIARESFPFVAVLALLAVAAWFVAHPAFVLVPVCLLLFTLWFFRDPERIPPDDPAALVSPADGKVILVKDDRVSVFMNVFDVHVCRTPIAGRLESVDHQSGRFMAAWRDEASEHNERAALIVSGAERELTVTLVAGLVARRIVLWVAPGRELKRGERIGLIRFGSRVDVRLPPGTRPEVRSGERVQAGVTILARVAGAAERD